MNYLVIAEDYISLREYLVEVFELFLPAGYELIVCSDGKQAIEAILKNRDKTVALFTDYQMPIADGAQVITKTAPHLMRVVISSAVTLPNGVFASLEKLTNIRSIPKPISPTQIQEAIKFLTLSN